MCKPCEDAGRTTVATMCHHVVPYEGDDEAAFYLGELLSVCRDCHELLHDRAPSRGFSREIDVFGWPVDPSHEVYKREAKHR